MHTQRLGRLEFHLILRVIPRSIDLPQNWDAEGNSTNSEVRSKVNDQQTYVDAVREAETQLQLPSMLSANLGNDNKLGLATSMRLFAIDGKMGWYPRALVYLER